ncbi:protein O-mannosyl-transferase TMTC1-like [Macrosteles quadrilineatus]|uniref:protein O-mannosyl-transferase TMTC1-like n=1 Tax=Macrosteles quadrilineatus TaxID=74068 RepID=UPI0023E1D2E6|nr:protein O-mannosyl-transferase TMTC1-like [Macrosteles quadrilineatus]
MARYLVVAGVAAACYANALYGEFVHDDVVAVVRNPDVLGTQPLLSLLGDDFWGTPLADPRSHKSYRPLTTLTFRLNHWAGGLQPVWFHAVNILLHAVSCALLTRVALVVAGLDARFATVAGLLFAVHPVHTEAVAGVVGRADVLACLLFLLSFIIYHDEGWRWKSSVLWSCVVAGLSMLAKETGVTVLLVNLGYDFYHCWPHLKRALSEAHWNKESLSFARRTVKILLTTSMLLAFRIAMLQGSLPKFSSQDNPTAFHPCLHVRLLTFWYLAAFNWWLLLCPSILSHDWQMGSIPLVTSLTVTLLLTFWYLAAFNWWLLLCPSILSHDWLLTFWYLAAFNWWLLLCPSILSHDWQMGSIPLVTSLADCRNLTTGLLLTFCLLLAYRLIAEFEHQRSAPLVLGVLLLAIPFLPAANIFFTVGFVVAERVLYIPSLGAALLVAYGAQTLHQASSPRGRNVVFIILLLLGATFTYRTVDRNRAWSSREALIKSGIKAVPQNAKMHYNLANYLRDNNSLDKAITHYKEAIRLWPGYASAHNNLGTLMSSPSEAEGHFKSAITISPSHVNAHYNLGQVYRKMNRTAEAVKMLEACLRLDTSYSPAYLVLAKLHSPPIAAKLLYHVTRLLPNSPDYQAYYADWLFHHGMILQAEQFYLKALRLQHNHLDSFLGTARCLRARGQIARLHQLLIRWYLLQRGRGGLGRLVYAAELYVRGWDMYRPGQSTNTATHLPSQECVESKRTKQRWWRGQGTLNHTPSVCSKALTSPMDKESSPLDPAAARLCVDKAEPDR